MIFLGMCLIRYSSPLHNVNIRTTRINKDMIKIYTAGIHFTTFQIISLSVRITILARFVLDMMPRYGLKQVINK
jgi:hypothetical protein